MHAREEQFLTPVALTVAVYRRYVQLAGAPEGTTNFYHLVLLLEALRDAIRALPPDNEKPAALPFSFTIPGEPCRVHLHSVCDPDEGIIIQLSSRPAPDTSA